jgi:hypothetical protein
VKFGVNRKFGAASAAPFYCALTLSIRRLPSFQYFPSRRESSSDVPKTATIGNISAFGDIKPKPFIE